MTSIPNTLDELAQLYHKMGIDASDLGDPVRMEILIEFMKYTKHLEYILGRQGIGVAQ